MYLYLGGYFLLNAFRAVTNLNSKSYTILFHGIVFAMFIFAAFRFQVGCDWEGYYYNYLIAERLPWSEILVQPDVAWWLSLSLILTLDLPFPYANIVPAILLFIGLYHLARKQPDPMAAFIFAFPIIVMGLGMSGIRQGAALGLLCFAFTALRDRRKIRFIIFVLCASLWHSSALSFIILLPLLIARDARRQIFLAGVLAVPIILLLLSTTSADVALARHTGDAAASAGGAPVRLGVLALTGLFFFLFLRSKWRAVFPNDGNVMTIFAIAMIASPALIPMSSVIADRLGYYLMIPQIAMLASIPYFLRRRDFLIGEIFAFGLMGVYIVLWMGFSSLFETCYVPYQNWLGGMPSASMI